MKKLYLRFRKIIDGDWSTGPGQRPGTLTLLGFFLFVGGPVALAGRAATGWVIGAMLGLAWLGFAGWRAIRMMKAGSKRGDRHYDRVIRPLLSSDYRHSESATASARRHARKRS